MTDHDMLAADPSDSGGMIRRFVTYGSRAGVVGGGLRIIAAFIPYAPDQAWLEGLYAAIDIGMLFGLVAAWLLAADAVGMVGLGGFAVALIGLASIIGPDSPAFGIDFYLLGSGIFMLGLTGLSIQLVRRRVLVAAGGLWLGAAGAGVIFALSSADAALVASGVLLGLGYLVAGRAVSAANRP